MSKGVQCDNLPTPPPESTYSSLQKENRDKNILCNLFSTIHKFFIFMKCIKDMLNLFPYQNIFFFAARRRKSTPLMSRIHPLMKVRCTSNKSASSWKSRRAFSLDEPTNEKIRYSTQSTMAEDLCKQDVIEEVVQNARSSKFSRLEHVRNGGKISTFDPAHDIDCSYSSEVTPVTKLKKFLNNVLEKLFDDKNSETTPDHPQEKAHGNLVPMDTNLDLSAKLSALMSHFSLQNRPRYLNSEFFSLLAKKLFPSKEEFDIDGFEESSVACREDCDEKSWGRNGDHSRGLSPPNDVIIGLREKKTDGRLDEDGADDWNGVSLGVVARLVETLASSSDAESDSSSSSDYITSDSSAAEDCDRVRSRNVTRSNKVFHHTTVNCQDKPEKESAKSRLAPEDSLSSSSSSSLSASSSLSSSSPSSSTKPPKKVKSKLHQRYYHVFCAGELVKLVQDGIPSAVLLKEYHDHGNWAAVWEKESIELKS